MPNTARPPSRPPPPPPDERRAAPEPTVAALRGSDEPTEHVAAMQVRVVRASPAALWRRLGAWLVDAIALGVLIAAYVALAVALAKHPPPPTQSTGLDWLVNRGEAYRALLLHAAAVGAALSVLYGALLHARLGWTLGERAFGIRMVGRRGQGPSLLVCVLRALLALFSIALLGLGFLLALFLRRRRALHDVLSATYVVRLLAD